MVSPKVERTEESRDYGKFTISPLERGYGVTLGNALRRTLLSSLDGAAVTSVHITDVMHEFSTIEGVREDVIQVMLQLKLLASSCIMLSQPVFIWTSRSRHHHWCGYRLSPEVEIVNPELYLFSINEPNSHVEMDMTVEAGRGYMPATDRTERLAIGVLPVDAIFSPVRRVNWKLPARVGHSTDYDRLTLEIWTDGTLSPEKALIDSSRILMRQLGIISGTSEDMLTKPAEEIEVEQLRSTANILKPRSNNLTWASASSIH